LEERVQRLLAGDPVGSTELNYELDVWHLGVVASGARAKRALEDLASKLGRELLFLPRGEIAWAWLGGRRRFSFADAGRLLVSKGHGEVSLAIGEPREGIQGFRVTHLQAQAAHRVARRRSQPITRFRDVVLLTMALHDEAYARWLVELYLPALDDSPKRSLVMRQTMRAYFLAERNISAAAKALEVARHTVEYRLRTIEERLERPLSTCLTELELALCLEELGFTATAAEEPPPKRKRRG
jgi:sugar diacid utilization regulator